MVAVDDEEAVESHTLDQQQEYQKAMISDCFVVRNGFLASDTDRMPTCELAVEEEFGEVDTSEIQDTFTRNKYQGKGLCI